MSNYYEIVIFTAALKDYADWVLNQLDPKGLIKYRLYRQHATPYEANYIKDLSRIGRSLNKTIIVDNLSENFQLQYENGIMIKSWFDDPNDTALFELAPILTGILNVTVEIVMKKVEDVRDALKKYNDQMAEQNEQGANKFHFSLDNE